MLYLHPPFNVINGVSILPDHADPLQYYYMPLYPKLTTIGDGGIDVPQLQLIKYRGRAGDGGFLNFDVNVGLDQDELDRIKGTLRAVEELDDEPRLSAMPLVDGTVRMLLFGGDSSVEPPGEEPVFTPRIHHAKPALYGSNQAVFSVELSAEQVTLFEAAVAGEITPIAVIYSLDYLALRPAYSVRVTAEWDRVQRHINESFSAGILFVSTQVDKVIDELIEERIITIQIDSFIPPDEDAGEILARLDAAVNEVKDLVLDTFFEPSIDPRDPDKKDGLTRFTDNALRAHRSVLMSGIGPAGGLLSAISVKRKNVDLTRIDKKTFDFDMRERTTVRKTIHPQGHLSGLLRTIRDADGQIDLDRFVVPVDLDDPWFEDRRIRVISRADFAADDIESVSVQLDYQGKSKGVLLDPSTTTVDVTWESVLDTNGQVVPEATASYELSFRSDGDGARPLTMTAEATTVLNEHLEVRPHELYRLAPVSILALDFPWENYPTIEVQVDYTDQTGGLDDSATFLLTETKPSLTWKLFSLPDSPRIFAYKVIYRAGDHRDVEMPWEQTDLEQIVIRDPFPDKRRLDVVAAVNPAEVNLVFVDATYHDEQNGVRLERKVVFENGVFGRKPIEFPIVDPEQRLVTYRVLVIGKDGEASETPESATVANRIIVTGRPLGHRIIQVEMADEPFDAHDLEEVQVELKHEDRANGLLAEDRFTFRSATDRPRYFEYDYLEGSAAYEFRSTYLLANGLSRTTSWQEQTDPTLTVTPD